MLQSVNVLVAADGKNYPSRSRLYDIPKLVGISYTRAALNKALMGEYDARLVGRLKITLMP